MNKTIYLAPAEPMKHDCPECAVEGVKRRLRFLRSFSEQWVLLLLGTTSIVVATSTASSFPPTVRSSSWPPTGSNGET